MLRLVRLGTGGIGQGQGFGRSAYVCRSKRCLQDARRRKRFQKSLRIPNHPTIDAMIDAMLAAELDKAEPDDREPDQDSPVA